MIAACVPRGTQAKPRVLAWRYCGAHNRRRVRPGRARERGVMRGLAVIALVFALPACAGPAAAATKKQQPVVIRSASGTVIQPTRTIIHNPNGTTTVIVVPRRSYLDTGTEVSVGDRSFQDYVLPPAGDPGRPNWFYGPDVQGRGQYPLPGLHGMAVPGINPYTPF